MDARQQTGRFWLCPACRKHVPARSNACSCGFDRTSVPTQQRETAVREPAPEAEPTSLWRALGVVGVIACALVLAAYAWIDKPAQDAAGQGLARRLRARTEPPPPQIIVVPAAPATAPQGTVVPAPVDEPAPTTMPSTAPVMVSEPRPVYVPATVPPQAEETESDRRRRVGILEVERAMQEMSVKADQADIAWQRFITGCHVNETWVSSYGAAGAVAGDRNWLVAAYAETGSTFYSRQWSDSCAEAGAFFALADQVERMMCLAEETARRSMILPGTVRDFRHRYRLEWRGWDAVCR